MAQRSGHQSAVRSTPGAGAGPWLWVALALVGAGLALAVVLTHNYYRHLLAGQVSGCSISAYVDCDRVSESRYAAVAGVPISALAIAVYGALAVLLALPLLRPLRRLAAVNLDLAAALAALTALTALALAAVAALEIRALCLYCALLQAVSIALFVVLAGRWWRSRAGRGAGGRQARGFGPAAGSALLALAAGAVPATIAVLGFEANALAVADRAAGVAAAGSASASRYLSRSAISFDTGDSPAVGPPDAPVQVVVFGDYNCSHCRDFDPEALRLAEDFAGAVRVVFKFFPLDATCNRFMQRESSSCLAAAAAYAAHQQDRFLDYHLLLFEHFQNHAPQRLLANAEEAGITDQEAFVAALGSAATLQRIERDIDEGARGGVQGTPTIFVNGRRLVTSRLPQGATRYQVLVQEIRVLLRAAL